MRGLGHRFIPNGRRTPATEEVAMRLTADVVFKPDVDWLEDVVGNPLTLAIEVHA
jgi:hypothetical protein